MAGRTQFRHGGGTEQTGRRHGGADTVRTRCGHRAGTAQTQRRRLGHGTGTVLPGAGAWPPRMANHLSRDDLLEQLALLYVCPSPSTTPKDLLEIARKVKARGVKEWHDYLRLLDQAEQKEAQHRLSTLGIRFTDMFWECKLMIHIREDQRVSRRVPKRPKRDPWKALSRTLRKMEKYERARPTGSAASLGVQAAVAEDQTQA